MKLRSLSGCFAAAQGNLSNDKIMRRIQHIHKNIYSLPKLFNIGIVVPLVGILVLISASSIYHTKQPYHKVKSIV